LPRQTNGSNDGEPIFAEAMVSGEVAPKADVDQGSWQGL
jgi:hypothetical protein